MPQPHVRVITLAKDDEVGLIRTRRSVLGQSYNNIRHILVPGMSSDATEKVARNIAGQSGVEVWEGAPSGIYPAMNWALDRIDPDHYVIFMNSGDFFLHRHAIIDLAFAMDHSGADWSTGGFLTWAPGGWIRGIAQYCESDTEFDVGHQSTLVRAGLLQAQGGFDTSFRIFADSQLMRKVMSSGPPGVTSSLVAAYGLGGFSSFHPISAWRELRRLDRETPLHRQVAESHGSLSLLKGLLSSARFLAYEKKFIGDWVFRRNVGVGQTLESRLDQQEHWEGHGEYPKSINCCLRFYSL